MKALRYLSLMTGGAALERSGEVGDVGDVGDGAACAVPNDVVGAAGRIYREDLLLVVVISGNPLLLRSARRLPGGHVGESSG